MDAFDYKLGEGQGRLDGGGFVLGCSAPKVFHELSSGDYVEVVQQVDLTEEHFVRMEGEILVPGDGASWEVSIVVDGVKHETRTVTFGSLRRLSDFCANVSKLTGDHEVGVRLEML